MAGAVIGALRGVLGLDTAAFERGAKRSKATMGDVERRFDRMAARVDRIGKRMTVGLTAPMAAMATVAVKSSLQTVDAQAKMAQSFGTTVKSLQVLERAGDLAGVSMGEVQQASIQLSKRLSQAAAGGGAAAKVLERLHLRAQDLQQLPLDERLAKIQGAMTKFIPEAERAAVASDLFGSRAGLIFTRIDTATLATATRDVERFGVAVSEVDAEQIEVTNDALSRLGLVSKGLANQLTASLAAPLEVIANKAADAAAWFTGLSDETKRVIAVSATLAAGLGPIALGLGAIIKLSAPVVTGLIAITGAAKALSLAVIVAAGPWGILAGAAVAAAGYLLLFRDNSGKVEGAAYDAAAGTAALSGELAAFTNSYAPQAAKSAIDLANDNYKLAASAFEAAKAEVAKRKAIAEAALIEYDAASDPEAALILGDRSDKAYLALAGAVEKYRKQEIVLQQTLAERSRVTAVVTGSDTKMAESLKKVSTELDISVKGLDKFSGGAKGAGKGLDDLIPKIDVAADVIENRLMTGIDGAAGAFGDLVASGFEDFEGFTDGLKATFRRALADMASTAARNKITVWLGLGSTGGVAGTAVASAATGGGGAGGGLLGGLLGNVGGGLLGGGGFLGGIGTGLGGVLSGGGLGSSFANLGGLLSGASGGAGAIGAAIPAVGVILAATAVLSKALSRKYAGTAIRGTLGAEGFDGTSFDFYKGGALRSNKANYKAVPEAIQAMLDTTMRGVTTGLTSMATVLGLSTGALAGFNDEQFTLWTNGKDQAQIQQELGVFIEGASDKMAALVLGTDAFTRAGESAHDALTRLSTGLGAANDQADLLGHRMFAVSLAGADLASDLVDAFGGVEAMATATGAYWQAVYSEAERNEATLRRLRATFADLGLAMPESRAELRGLVEGFDT
ncbi:MAG: hypothetical protein MRY77_05670, partial [Rhodobacteraceae bacterium]|nr:hypothetical protein [Paracoccaceae bacterium]